MAVLLSGVERHASPLLPLFLVCGLSVIVRVSRLARFAPAAALVGTLLVVLVAAPQTPRSLRRSLLATLGGDPATAALSYNVSIVTGDYWSVWPVTFALRYLIPPALLAEPVIPVALRADPMIRAHADQIRTGATVLVIPYEDLASWNGFLGLPTLDRVPGTAYDIRTIR